MNVRRDSNEGFSAQEEMAWLEAGEVMCCNVCPNCGRCDPAPEDSDHTCDECLSDMFFDSEMDSLED